MIYTASRINDEMKSNFLHSRFLDSIHQYMSAYDGKIIARIYTGFKSV